MTGNIGRKRKILGVTDIKYDDITPILKDDGRVILSGADQVTLMLKGDKTWDEMSIDIVEKAKQRNMPTNWLASSLASIDKIRKFEEKFEITIIERGEGKFSYLEAVTK